jgi:hypothetical protein
LTPHLKLEDQARGISPGFDTKERFMLAGTGFSRRSGLRGGIRALAVLAIASGLVVGTATIAEAKQINSVKELKASCAKGSGTFTAGVNSTSGICDLPGGKTVYCNNKTKKCSAVDTIKARVAPKDSVRAPKGVELTTQTVSDSHVWKQKLSIPVLTDVVCPSLGGDFAAAATIGACSTPTATIICTDNAGTNCLGIAKTEKQATSIPQQVKTAVGNAGSTPTSPTTTPTTPTTSGNAPPTTQKCEGRGCPPPTLPPGKAPGQSVPVTPPQNR